MPRVNIYIRKENEKAWEEFGGSEFVNRALQSLPEMRDAIKMAYDPVKQTVVGKPIKKVLETTAPINKADKDYSVCIHNQVKGFCKKGCK